MTAVSEDMTVTAVSEVAAVTVLGEVAAAVGEDVAVFAVGEVAAAVGEAQPHLAQVCRGAWLGQLIEQVASEPAQLARTRRKLAEIDLNRARIFLIAVIGEVAALAVHVHSTADGDRGGGARERGHTTSSQTREDCKSA